MLELLEEDVRLLIVSAIFARLFCNIHFVLVHFSFVILQNQFFTVILMLETIHFRLERLQITDVLHIIVLNDLVLEEDVPVQHIVHLPQLLHLALQENIFLIHFLNNRRLMLSRLLLSLKAHRIVLR